MLLQENIVRRDGKENFRKKKDNFGQDGQGLHLLETISYLWLKEVMSIERQSPFNL